MGPVTPALPEARESLSYWESRLQTLPKRSVRARREAREMAARWRERVAEAERAEYGAGFLGAVFMAMAERRLPTQTSRQLVRVGKGAVIVAATTVAVMTLLAMVLFVALLALIF
jgi:hypothetical protein